MSTWDSSRKPFWCTYRFPWQPNNQCPGTLHLGHIYCWPGDAGVQRSENCWKRGSGLNKQHWHQWQNIQNFIPEIQGKSRWPLKGCRKKKSIWWWLFIRLFTCICMHLRTTPYIVVADCFKLRHTTACKWDIYNHNAKDLILFIFNISLIYIHINIHVYSF